MNKLLFLDFDGVLHPIQLTGESPFNRAHLLEEVLVGQELGIVISSSWRFTHNLEKLRKLLPGSISNQIIGVTGSPVIGKHPRFNEIANYMNNNGLSDWRALDDSYWEFPSPCLELVKCNPNTGITDKQAKEIKQWLSA